MVHRCFRGSEWRRVHRCDAAPGPEALSVAGPSRLHAIPDWVRGSDGIQIRDPALSAAAALGLRRKETNNRRRAEARLGARELDKNGEIIKDNLPAYKNLKQKALTPAVDEINEKSDLSVSFIEEKQKGSKAITALNFRIRKNLETAGKFDELKLPKKSQMELPLEQPSLSMEEHTQIDRISGEFALNAKQAEALADYIARDGITYLLEKADIVRSEPRQNAARAFIAALRDDWKKPVAIVDQQKAENSRGVSETAQI